MKHVLFNGLKFTKDEKTGYYLNSTIRKRLHVYVWEYYNGKVPKGYDVHHKNGDKSTTDVTQLELLTRSDHQKEHWKNRTNDEVDKFRENMNENARPKAIEWHKSEEGMAWHKKHYENTKIYLHQRRLYECKCCGNEFCGIREGFCSNKCKSKYRRINGLDDIERICPCCGKTFKANKYSKRVTCSKSCSNTYRSKKKEGGMSEKN